MDVAYEFVVIVTIVLVVGTVARRWQLSEPLVLLAAGLVLSYVPYIPNPELTPDVVLVGLLPPLLYASAIRTSLIDFTANRRPILLLSVGLVLVTTVGVGLVAWWLLPVPLAVAFALGAVVAPPDAVAATAVARRVGLPRRIVTILEGESLVNDAAAIVTLRTAIAAIAGTVTVLEVGLEFFVSAAGGVLVGLLVAFVVGRVRRRLTDDLTDVALSLTTPFIAYLLAEQVRWPGTEATASGILAVVAAGLLLGHQSPVIQSANSRLFERTNWSTISFLLGNAVFLLIGLQVQSIVGDAADSGLSAATVAIAAAGVFVAVVAVRFCYIFPAVYLPGALIKRRRQEPVPPWTDAVIIGWAGMRGVVTLAAVFLLPMDTPYRSVLVLIALIVTVGTLLVQGLTLPWLIRRLRVQGPDRHEDHLQEAQVYQAAADAGLRYLEEHVAGTVSDEVMTRLRDRATGRANAVWERLGGLETPSAQYSRARAEMLERERQELLRIRGEGQVDQFVLQRVLDALDVEESILDRLAEDETTAEREEQLRPRRAAGCEHLVEAARSTVGPTTPQGCEECLRDGTSWLHLRMCTSCGHVGCCDSSIGAHASSHFRETGHPVMRSFEPGEAWKWCFVDGVTG